MKINKGRLTAEDKELAREMYNQVPDEHKFLFEEYMNE